MSFKALVFLLCLIASNIMAQTTPRFFVDTSWLAKSSNMKDLVIVDVRSKNQYKTVHIEGSINLDVAYTYRNSGKTYLMKTPKDFEAYLSANGIKNDQTIILYDSGELKSAARYFWILEYLGHKNVLILNGGLEKWQNEKRAISKTSKELKVSQYSIKVNKGYHANKKAVMWAIKSKDMHLIDTRKPHLYKGEDGMNHIPTAVNIPTKNYFKDVNGNKVAKNVEELKPLFGKYTKGRKVITYCNRGKESGLAFILLRQAGANVSHYDGSWPEWLEEEK